MNFAGNDNYQPGMVPPDPVKQKSGWLSSNMAQLMVFLNGVILTITAFATLNIFINEIVRDNLLQTSDQVERNVQLKFSSMEEKFSSLAFYFKAQNLKSIDELPEYITNRLDQSDVFENIFLVSIAEGGSESFPIWGDKNLFDQKDIEEFIERHSFHGGLLSSLSSRPQNTQGFDVGVFTFDEVFDNENVTHLGRISKKRESTLNDNIMLASLLSEDDGVETYLVGVFTLNSLFDSGWLKSNNSIKNIDIEEEDSGEIYFSYARDGYVEEIFDAGRYINAFLVSFSGHNLEVKIDMMISMRHSFLQKIPLLMLLFGVTLTLIGTLYVRNNQQQSKKLSEVNKELAHKNFELNQEMSERERLTQIIQKSALENRSIINAVSDIIVELSPQGNILFLNDAWVKVTGFELDHSIGKDFFDLLHAENQETQKNNFNSFIKGQKNSYRSFAKLRSASGLFRAVELSISMIRYNDDNDMHVVGTITDVEERRRAEKALSEAEKKYRQIVENAASGIYQVTPEGQFLSANPALAKILGYERPEDVIREIDKAQNQLYIDPYARERFLNEVNAQKSVKYLETQIKRLDGQVIWVSENVRPVYDDEGTLLFYEGSMEDVDQRKNAEIGLKGAKLESDLANRAKSEFLANMSHELRTPLNSIIGFSDIIKTQAFGKVEQSEYLEYAENIHESGKRLLNVINEILDVSRIESGNRDLNESVINICDITESCLALMEGKIKENHIRIENKIIDKTLAFVGEEQAVKQMMLNLLSNAVKFSPENSMIVIDEDIDSKGRLCISISDTGIGLTESEMEKALSPFGQVDTEHSRSKSGTGLGLTLVKALIELHGGELDMVSQKGIGTTVTLIFPARRVAKSEQRQKNTDSVNEQEQAELSQDTPETLT